MSKLHGGYKLYSYLKGNASSVHYLDYKPALSTLTQHRDLFCRRKVGRKTDSFLCYNKIQWTACLFNSHLSFDEQSLTRSMNA